MTLPSTWRTVALAEVGRVYSGGTPSRAVPAYWGGRVPWVSTAEVGGSVITSTKESITEAGLANSAAKVAPAGTLVMAMYGQGKTRGKTSILGIDAAMNQACAAIEPHASVDPGYLLAYLQHNYEMIRGLSNAGGQQNLSGQIVKRIPVVLPPLAEQKRIARAIRDIEDHAAALGCLISKKEAIKRSLMQQLLTGRTRLPGFSAEWHPVKLRDAGATYGGLTGKGKGDFGVGPGRFVTFVEVMSGVRLFGRQLERVRVVPGERQNQVMRGDVLFNGSSETPEEVALAAAVEFDPSPTTYLNSFCFGYRLKNDSLIDPIYLAYYFRSSKGRALVSALAQGATRYNIAKTKLMEMRPLLPNVEEQRAIVDVLLDFETEIRALNTRLTKARDIKIGMMQQLLTGRTRLPVETAS